MKNTGPDSRLGVAGEGDTLVLGFDMTFADLYRRTGLLKLDQSFLNFLNDGDPDLHTRFEYAGRAGCAGRDGAPAPGLRREKLRLREAP